MSKEIIWSTEKRLVRDLIPADYNPRQIGEKEKADLMVSVVEFGKVVPVVVNIGKRKNVLIGGHRKNVLIGGHRRTEIYADLGILIHRLLKGFMVVNSMNGRSSY